MASVYVVDDVPAFADPAAALADFQAVHCDVTKTDNEVLRASLTDGFPERAMVGQSRLMRELHNRCRQVAQSNATALVMGESGAGKELVAREIHRLSSRAARPMLAINCAALSSNLLESELFGHEQVAFSGADRESKGRFVLADGGTLLLDEISELALPLQAKLLRLLQEQQFERVGGNVRPRADVRVIVTTNRNLADWVSQGKFREDLYYRLNVLPVVVPPLRHRRDDVPLLTDYFLDRIACRDGRKPARLEPAASRLLRDYHWPGNVRELENVCERAAVMAGAEVVRAGAIEAWLQGQIKYDDGFRNLRPGFLLQDMERQLIERTLLQFNGHREKTARTLGIGVRTLGMKLKKWHAEARQAG